VEKLAQETFELIRIRLSSSQLQALKRYRDLLLEWNTVHNLTAIRHPEEIRAKHFLDSLSCTLAWQTNPPNRLIDVGTGAGFPGLVIKILYPQMKLTLVESVHKKLDFCQKVTEQLNLEGVTLICQRAEEVGQLPDHREKYDWAVGRAVANLPVLTEYLLPLVRRGGAMLAMKGETAPAEVQSASFAIQVLGGHLRRLLPVTLPGVADQRYLVIIDKIATTPPGYPRKTGTPARRPLIKDNHPVSPKQSLSS
jgi:16S rRNA (guanine527-N7)-methyltransferase